MPRTLSRWLGAILLVTTGIAMADESQLAAPPPEPGTTDGLRLTDFGEGAEPRWIAVNDNVMGGRSRGGPSFEDGVLVFSGSTNTDGGGFSSIRTRPAALDLAGHDGLRVRIRTDRRSYRLTAETDERVGPMRISYWAEIPGDASRAAERKLSREDERTWQVVRVPFERFVAHFRGRKIPGRSLDPSRVRSIGLMIYDGEDGPFRLEVEEITAYRSHDPELAERSMDVQLLTDFDETREGLRWFAVNDKVMGGRSRGGPSFEKSTLIFTGATNTNGGGFSSIRAEIEGLGLTGASGLRARVRGDGRTYRARVGTGERVGGMSVAYYCEFKTSPDEDWHDVELPFASFRASVRGRALPDRRVNPEQVESIGLMIYDGKDGPFRLDVDRIEVYRSIETPDDDGDSPNVRREPESGDASENESATGNRPPPRRSRLRA